MEKVKVYFTELQQEEIMEIMNQERIEKQDVKLAVAFFKLVRYSYGSGCKTFGCRPYDVRKAFNTVWQISDRLANTVIENKDFEALIIQYDRSDAFFYLDPPYNETEGHYSVVFTKEDHIRLRDTLKKLQESSCYLTMTVNLYEICTKIFILKDFQESTIWLFVMIRVHSFQKC